MSEQDTVWVLPSSSGSEPPKLHTVPDCSALQRADGEPIEEPAKEFPDWREVCSRQRCASVDVDLRHRHTHPRYTEARQENRQSVYEALAAAAEPLTRRQVQLEAFLSDKVATKTLNDLRDLGQVEQVENPDDGRIPRYRLASMCLEAGPRQRAQLTPPAAVGFATVFVGLVLLVGYAIASGVLV